MFQKNRSFPIKMPDLLITQLTSKFINTYSLFLITRKMKRHTIYEVLSYAKKSLRILSIHILVGLAQAEIPKPQE